MKLCKLCGKRIKNREFVDGEWRNFQRRKYCLDCSPFKSGNTKKLEKCKTLSPEEIQEKKKKKNKNCIEWQRKARKERKIKLVEIFGGKCPFCGYNKCYKAFDFHHVDPSEKDISLATIGFLSKWEKIIQEVKKCILVCSNCHREVHADFISQDQVETVYNNNLNDIMLKLNEELQKYLNKNKNVESNFCLDCSAKIDKRSKRCFSCNKANKRKVKDRPSKEFLLKEVEESNYCAVGRKYGVTDNTIRKWIKFAK